MVGLSWGTSEGSPCSRSRTSFINCIPLPGSIRPSLSPWSLCQDPFRWGDWVPCPQPFSDQDVSLCHLWERYPPGLSQGVHSANDLRYAYPTGIEVYTMTPTAQWLYMVFNLYLPVWDVCHLPTLVNPQCSQVALQVIPYWMWPTTVHQKISVFEIIHVTNIYFCGLKHSWNIYSNV